MISCLLLLVLVEHKGYGFPLMAKPKCIDFGTRRKFDLIRVKGNLSRKMCSASLNGLSKDASESNLSDKYQLKLELQEYLKIRSQKLVMMDNEKKKIGGTKGNAILEYVSAPVPKETEIEEKNLFDYDELTNYGFGHLVKPIMEMGGRSEAYILMDMTPPSSPDRLKPKEARKIVIDRDGSYDEERYRGIRVGSDDDELGRQLEELQKRKNAKNKKTDSFVAPFSDIPKSNFSPDWTPSMLDDEARRRGRVIALLQAEEAAKKQIDQPEALRIEGGIRVYSTFIALLTAFAYGHSSDQAFFFLNIEELRDSIQVAAILALVISLGSSIAAAVVADRKHRDPIVWAIKGAAGGPLALIELNQLESLQICK